jgi:hypothetical protein
MPARRIRVRASKNELERHRDAGNHAEAKSDAVTELSGWGDYELEMVARGNGLSCCATQDRDMLLLSGELNQVPELIVVAVFELCRRYIDRALMLRDHDGREIAIDMPGRREEHIARHVADRQIVGEEELLLLGLLRC